MESRSGKCPSCYAPLQPGVPFCGQCGFDLPAGEPGAKPRPEKCPFCSEPVEYEEPACRQCGFDFDHEWEPEASEQETPFDPKVLSCRDCGQPNPDWSYLCFKCNAPISSTVALMPGIEGVWFIGYFYRRLVGPIGTLPQWGQVTRRILGIVELGGGVAVILCAPWLCWEIVGWGSPGSFLIKVLAALIGCLIGLPLGAISVYFGWLMLGGRPLFRGHEPTAAARPEQPPANGPGPDA